MLHFIYPLVNFIQVIALQQTKQASPVGLVFQFGYIPPVENSRMLLVDICRFCGKFRTVSGQLPPGQLPPGQLPPDKYPPDNYPPRTNTPWTFTPPEKFFKHLPWYSLNHVQCNRKSSSAKCTSKLTSLR